jgi:hypothetical protein
MACNSTPNPIDEGLTDRGAALSPNDTALSNIKRMIRMEDAQGPDSNHWMKP